MTQGTTVGQPSYLFDGWEAVISASKIFLPRDSREMYQ